MDTLCIQASTNVSTVSSDISTSDFKFSLPVPCSWLEHLPYCSGLLEEQARGHVSHPHQRRSWLSQRCQEVVSSGPQQVNVTAGGKRDPSLDHSPYKTSEHKFMLNLRQCVHDGAKYRVGNHVIKIDTAHHPKFLHQNMSLS